MSNPALWLVSLFARFRIPVDTDWNRTQIETVLTQEMHKARNQAQDTAAILNVSRATNSQAVSHLERSTNSLARAMCNGPCPPSERFSMREPAGCLGTHSTRRLQRLAWLACNLHPPDCVVLSIGIGGDWEFELLALARGCEVHAFDPTLALRKQHMQMARLIQREFPRLQFHLLGLGGPKSKALSGGAQGNQYDRAGTGLAELIQLDEMMARFARGRRVDILKIDCEGCEHEAFNHVASHAPQLLCSVAQLSIEVHFKVAENVTTQHDVAAWMRHVWDEHGFRSFRTVLNTGWDSPLFQLRHITGLENSGLSPDVCCYNVQMLKGSAQDRVSVWGSTRPPQKLESLTDCGHYPLLCKRRNVFAGV